MAMTYSSLTSPKGSAGSVAGWVNYNKLDIPTVVDEAQSLIYTALRVREMRETWTFGMSIGQCEIALPDRFLDPIGSLYDVGNGIRYSHGIESDIVSSRTYDSTISGAFAANPFTTTANSSLVSVQKAAHGLNQGSTIFVSGSSATGGLTLNGAFPIVSVTDANNYVIYANSDAASSATGGGSAATFTANNLTSGFPSLWSIWNEKVQFDCAFTQATTFKQLYYRSPKLLSATNPSNWLVNRYPMLMRKATQAAAADFMKDDNEYQKNVTALNNLIGSIMVENDLSYRGAEFGTDNP